MEQLTYDDQTFDKLIMAGTVTRSREFQSCTFTNCDFSNSTFAGTKFLDCTFDGCNLSMAKLDSSTLNDVTFKNCKMLGVNFSPCADFLFSVGFDNCILDYSSFLGKKMLKTKFIRSTLKDVTFSQANLSGSSFEGCDLTAAVFNRTDLSAVNFVKAFNYDIDPEINNMKKAVFSAQGLEGLLTKHQLKVV
jgi:fluoroquinolone resistance protein